MDETQDVWFFPPDTYQVIMENLRLPLLSLDIDRTIGSFFDLEFAEENNESLMRKLGTFYTVLVTHIYS